MKLIALLASLALAAPGCAHMPSKQSTGTVALTAAVVAGLVLVTLAAPCSECGNRDIAPQMPGSRP
jgi:hypothetical protein